LLAAGPRRTQLGIEWAAAHKEEPIEAPAEGNLGSGEHGNGPSGGCGPETGPTSPEPGQEAAPGGGTAPISAPQVPPSGGLDAQTVDVGP
jgi:hypothetical protein